MMMTLLFSKIVISAGMVVAVTATAERYGPRLGGLAASLPQLAAVSLVFFGLEQGLEFAAETAFWNISGICSTIPFVIGYVAGAALVPGHRLLSIAAGTLTGNVLFVFATATLGAIRLPALAVVPLAGLLCAGTLWFVRHLPDTAPLQRVGASVALLAVRAGVASVAVVVVTSVAHILGPKWSGLVTGYPVNALPVIAVLHFHYGLDVIRAMAKVWPIGVFGICIFNLIAWLTVARLGLAASILLGYIADLVYLLLVDTVRRMWMGREAAPSG
jgi:hypothetical protein